MANNVKIETKVKAATSGAAGGTIVAAFIDWFVDSYLITPEINGDNPEIVTLFIYLVVASSIAFVSGYLAKHTYRFHECPTCQEEL